MAQTPDQWLKSCGLPREDARLLARKATGWGAAELETRGDRPFTPRQERELGELLRQRRLGRPLSYVLGEKEFYGRTFFVDESTLIPRPDTETLIDEALRAAAGRLSDLGFGAQGARQGQKGQEGHEDREGQATRKGAAEAPGALGASGSLSVSDAPRFRILDLGTGSGAIAVTLALEWEERRGAFGVGALGAGLGPGFDFRFPADAPRALVVATDLSPKALAVAARNARALGAEVRFAQGDWFGALSPGEPPFDMIVSNPPYVREGDAHLSNPDLAKEPAMALVSGADGLDGLRRIAGEAPKWLKPGGVLLLEHGFDQGPAAARILRESGFGFARDARDLAGRDRVAVGRLSFSRP